MVLNESEYHPDFLRRRYDSVVKIFRDSKVLDAPDGRLTFGELDQHSDRIAHYLMQFQCSDCVIYLETTLQYFVSIVACMKAGIVAIPFDPDQKSSHLSDYFSDLKNPLCLTNTNLKDAATRAFDIPVLLAENEHFRSSGAAVRMMIQNAGEYPLHRVLTSGSSGKPKMVTINRNSEHEHFVEASVIYGYQSGRTYANLGKHTSSLVINCFWRVTLSGACFLCVDLKKESFSQIYKRLNKTGASGLQGPSTILGKFIEASKQNDPLTDIKTLIFGGEPLSPRVLRSASDLFHPDCSVILNYSSTETMLISAFKTTLSKAREMKKIPIGKPVPSKKVILIDTDGREVKKGDIGEVVVESKFIASDIHGGNSEKRLKETQAKTGYRTYVTGDLARWNKNNQLEHFGRKDNQFKINGIRIDTKEIEGALHKIEGIKKAVVLPVDISETQKQLFACIIREKPFVTNSNIYKTLYEQVQSSHIPAYIVEIKAIPVSSNGKTNKRKLQDLCRKHLKKLKNIRIQTTEPGTSTIEKFLKESWSNILKTSISEHSSSFFAEGGDSLAVSELVSQISEKYHLDLEPVWVFKYPHLYQQVEYLSNLLSDKDPTISVIDNSGSQETSINEIKDLLGL